MNTIRKPDTLQKPVCPVFRSPTVLLSFGSKFFSFNGALIFIFGEKMIRHSERDKRDLRALEVEMARLQEQLNAVKEERDAKVQEGMELVRGPSLITSRSEREGN